MNERNKGAWIPEDVFKIWESLRLDGSTWNTFLVIANQQYRYGGEKAHITLQDIAERTGYSLSTVKRSVSKLQKENHLIMLSRGRWKLTDGTMTAPEKHSGKKRGGVAILTPSNGQDHEPFTILLLSLINEDNKGTHAHPFTDGQIKTLNSVFNQISELLCCDDAMELMSPGMENATMSTTYRCWLKNIVATGSKKEAGCFVGAMLKLLRDERIIGKELNGKIHRRTVCRKEISGKA